MALCGAMNREGRGGGPVPANLLSRINRQDEVGGTAKLMFADSIL